MSVMKRMRDISVATLNDRLEKSQDPVKLIHQFLYEQREQINETERLVTQYRQHAVSMRQQYLTAAQLADKRDQQAQTALLAGEEQVARLALQEKIQNEEKSVQFKQLYEQAQQSLIELEDQLNRLKADYHEVYGKKQYYEARLQGIRLQQRMNERIGHGGGLQGSVFQKLDEKLSDMEWESQSLRQLRQAGTEAARRISHETQAVLETELAKLKAKLSKEG